MDRELFQDRISFPIYSALGKCEDSLLVGVSSTFGNYWTGALAVYQLHQLLNRVQDLPVTELDLTSQRITSTPFDASVASLVVLYSGETSDSIAVAVGLDDGSVQLVHIPKLALCTDKEIKEQRELALSINSATYHDWPIQRLATATAEQALFSLDVAGMVKVWDLQSQTPTSSWSIRSTSWPCHGQSLEPDLVVCAQSNSQQSLLATLLPCDLERQLVLWDPRVSSVLGGCMQSAHLVSDVSNDLPRSICCSSPNQLLVGTLHGCVHLYDQRYLTDHKQNEPVPTLASFEAGSWLGRGRVSDGSQQILQLVVQSDNPHDMSQSMIALVGLAGSVVVLELNSQTSCFTYHYHTPPTPVCTNPVRRSTGLFLPNVSKVTHWKLLHSTGLLRTNECPQMQSMQLHVSPDTKQCAPLCVKL